MYALKNMQVCRLGLIEFTEALKLQERLVSARRRSLIPDTLLLLQHPNVISLGRPESSRFLLKTQEELKNLGYPVVQAGRGGEVTFHGPGQLIAYPIINLSESHRDLHFYLRQLEEVGIRICEDLLLPATRVEGRTGVWVHGRKVAAIGIRARAWVTFHGMAINRDHTLQGFEHIVPCGLSNAEVTSLQGLTGLELKHPDLEKRFCQKFAEVFQRTLTPVDLSTLEQDMEQSIEHE